MEILVNWLIRIPRFPILILLYIIGLFIGFFFMLKPVLAIEIQRRCYARINWKIEPISLQKEIRNTRIMGCLLLAFLIVALILILAQRSIFL
jgi:hypothetical protein